MFVIGPNGFGILSPLLFVQFSCKQKANSRHSAPSAWHSNNWHGLVGRYLVSLLLIKTYKYAVWHFTSFVIGYFSLSNSKSAKVDKVRAWTAAAMLQCVLCGHVSAHLASIRITSTVPAAKQVQVWGGPCCRAQQSLPMSLSVWLHALSSRARCWARLQAEAEPVGSDITED